MLKAVRKRRAYEDIVDQIRKLIEKGRLRQGDQLPVEKELSETFKVSRLTVREAILSLETMNLVDRRQGNGTYVIASSEEAIVRPLAAALVREKDSLLDVFAVREIIEPEIARLAAKNGKPEEVADLLRIVEAQERELAKGSSASNTRFHRVLARMSRNKVMERLLFALMGILGGGRARNIPRRRNGGRNLCMGTGRSWRLYRKAARRRRGRRCAGTCGRAGRPVQEGKGGKWK